MKREWHEINGLKFDLSDIKDMSYMDLLVTQSQCKDYRKDYIVAEMKKRVKRKRLKLVN